MFTIKLTAKARRELKEISRRHRESIGLIFEEIKEDPFVGKALTREFVGRFSYKMGVYRIIYKIYPKEKTILIITAGHRATVYN